MNKAINNATVTLMERYLWIAQKADIDNNHELDIVIKMCKKCIDDSAMHTDKISRWLGFVQGILYTKGLINIGTERERSRRLFHDAYLSSGIKIPDSVDI